MSAEALCPQGIIASMGQGAVASGSDGTAGDHRTKGLTDQYGGDAKTCKRRREREIGKECCYKNASTFS